MALEGTHIRFAIEFREKLEVKNLQEYVAGCLYPDSRYKTGVERALTHPADFAEWKLAGADDFRKGWFTHLLCDKMQGMVFRKKFPHFFTGENRFGNPVWIALTAVKLLEDLEDARRFPITSFLPVTYGIRALNGETAGTLDEYYGLVAEAYSRPEELTIASYRRKLSALGLGDEYAAKVVARAEELFKNADTMKKINEVYNETVALSADAVAKSIS